MALSIRMARAGARKRPFYRIVVADRRSPRDGRFIERLGTYNPLLPKGEKSTDHRVRLNEARLKHWLEQGAAPSERVRRFLHDAGLMVWRAGNNPQKAKPRPKTLERLKTAAEAKKAAEDAARETAEKAAAEAESKAEEKTEPKAEEKAEEKAEPKAEEKTEEKAEAKTEDKPEAKAEEKAEEKTEDKTEAQDKDAPPSSAAEGKPGGDK